MTKHIDEALYIDRPAKKKNKAVLELDREFVVRAYPRVHVGHASHVNVSSFSSKYSTTLRPTGSPEGVWLNRVFVSFEVETVCLPSWVM